MIAARSRRALAAVLLLLAALTIALSAPAHATKKSVDPFCAGVTNTYVEACVGSLYDTVAALAGMVGMGMPL